MSRTPCFKNYHMSPHFPYKAHTTLVLIPPPPSSLRASRMRAYQKPNAPDNGEPMKDAWPRQRINSAAKSSPPRRAQDPGRNSVFPAKAGRQSSLLRHELFCDGGSWRGPDALPDRASNSVIPANAGIRSRRRPMSRACHISPRHRERPIRGREHSALLLWAVDVHKLPYSFRVIASDRRARGDLAHLWAARLWRVHVCPISSPLCSFLSAAGGCELTVYHRCSASGISAAARKLCPAHVSVHLGSMR